MFFTFSVLFSINIEYSIVDMPRVALLDIFAFGKFDMLSLCSSSI